MADKLILQIHVRMDMKDCSFLKGPAGEVVMIPFGGTAEGEIFTVRAENTGSYAYTVMAEHTDAQFEVIVNTPSVQAVKLPDGRIAASFFTVGSFSYQGSTYRGCAGTAEIFG